MTVGQALRKRLTDPCHPGSVADRSRRRRGERLLARFPGMAQMRVLDLGGRLDYWQHARVMPRELTLLNLTVEDVPEGVRSLQGDACDPPVEVRAGTYDLILSNSVIDQVGHQSRRVAMAEYMRSAAPHYWIQTASRYFPVDPYFLFPGLFAMSPDLRARVISRWPLSHARGLAHEEARDLAVRIDLMSARQLVGLFPDGKLVRERLGGVTKSLIVAR